MAQIVLEGTLTIKPTLMSAPPQPWSFHSAEEETEAQEGELKGLGHLFNKYLLSAD